MKNTAFSYKAGKSFLHSCPAWIKILIIPFVSIVVFKLPPIFAIVLFVFQMLLAFSLKFTLREQLCDLKAIIYYAVLLIFAKVAGFVCVCIKNEAIDFSLIVFPKIIGDFFTSERETWILLLKLFCVMQSASLIFKTSTSLEIREGLENIELAVRRFFYLKRKNADVAKAPVAQTISIFICFIPQMSKNWLQAERAWKARGGKKTIKMLLVLLPVFFSVGMKQAYNSARAISVRQ